MLRRMPPMLPPFLFLMAGILVADRFPWIGNHCPRHPFFLFSIWAGIAASFFLFLLDNGRVGSFYKEKKFDLNATKEKPLHKRDKLLHKEVQGRASAATHFIFLQCLFFFGVLGYILGFATFHPTHPENHVSHFTDKGPCVVTGTIVSEPESLWKRIRFEFQVETIRFDSAEDPFDVTGRVRMNIYSPDRLYAKGASLQVRSKIKGLRNFNNPGGFDYVRYMNLKGLYGQIGVNGKRVDVVKSSSFERNMLQRMGKALQDVRMAFSRYVMGQLSDRDTAAVLTALTTGQKDGISDELRHTFSVSGASHILAISGLHLSIIAYLFYHLFYVSLSFHPHLAIRGWGRKGALVLTILPLFIYALLSGWSPATRRAMIMISVFIMAALVDRESDGFNSLAIAGIIILSLDPAALYAISFQLSFGAVTFILAGQNVKKQVIGKLHRFSRAFTSPPKYFKYIGKTFTKIGKIIQKSVKGRMQDGRFFIVVTFFGDLTWMSLCAILGTQMLVMYYFNILSFSGLLTNFILIPVVGFLALPLGLTAFALFPFSTKLSTLFITLSGWILQQAIGFIAWVSELPYSWIETITPDGVELTVYYMGMGLFYLFIKQNGKDMEMSREQSIERVLEHKKKALGDDRRGKWIWVGLLLLIAAVHEAVWIQRRFFNADLKVTVLSVGQGNAALIAIPGGKRVLVDGGGFSYFSRFDTGEHIIAPFLRQNRILTLDAVILTHPESDHLNGLVYILRHFNVHRLIKNRDERETYAYRDLMEIAQEKGVAVMHPDGLPDFSLRLEKTSILFYSPFASKEKREALNYNDNSLVFQLRFGRTRFLFPGDIMISGEEALSRYGAKRLKSDILMAPHHGSKTSSSDFLLDPVDPDAVIISCGWQNRFGFPHPSVMAEYEKRGITPYRTDHHGAVTLISDGIAWKVETTLPEEHGIPDNQISG